MGSRDLIDGLTDKLKSKIILYENLLSLAGNIRKVVENDDFEELEELNRKEESLLQQVMKADEEILQLRTELSSLLGVSELKEDDIKSEFAIKVAKCLGKVHKYDAVILTVSHDKFRSITLPELKAAMTDHPILIDIRQIFKRSQAKKEGFYYQTL